MRLTPSDPDVQTIIKRIQDHEIDLQPDFQRGEVWSNSKKQRLVDSILRDWHIPPIHVIVDPDSGTQQVLDGQQRLVAIRDFVDGEFAIDGIIEPLDAVLSKHHGLKYKNLPVELKRRFDQFTIRVFRITDFLPSEPGELFYRLNQPTALTAAEQRNAFFGETRKQIKNLVDLMEGRGLGERFWGFSNARMSYEDILARASMALEFNSLKKKITAGTLADKFRSGSPFAIENIEKLTSAINILGDCKEALTALPKFNKATAQSWLVFLSTAVELKVLPKFDDLAQFIVGFEHARLTASLGFYNEENNPKLQEFIFRIYEDRSTARVADASSVQLRDFAIWWQFQQAFPVSPEYLKKIQLVERGMTADQEPESPAEVERMIISAEWGEPLWQ